MNIDSTLQGYFPPKLSRTETLYRKYNITYNDTIAMNVSLEIEPNPQIYSRC